jgi:hypothetical protein
MTKNLQSLFVLMLADLFVLKIRAIYPKVWP